MRQHRGATLEINWKKSPEIAGQFGA